MQQRDCVARTWRFRSTRTVRAVALLFLLAATLPAPLTAAERVILYFSRTPSIRAVFAENRPELQRVLSDGAVAVMTIGPTDIDPLATVRSGRYVRMDGEESAGEFPSGVLPIFEPPGDPSAGDALLRETRRRYPDAPVIALHAGPMVAPGSHGIAASLTVPSWVAVSSMYGRLYSETTRRAGVVSNLDVAPTISRFLDGKTPAATPGSPMWGSPPGAKALRRGLPFQVVEAMALQDALLAVARGTIPVNFGIAFGGIALLLLGAHRLIRRPRQAGRWIQYGILAVLMAPAAVGMAASHLPASVAGLLVTGIVLSVGLTALALALGRALAYAGVDAVPAALLLVTGGNAAWLLSAGWRGAIGIAVSPITNLYLTGIRFYGLGNEYAAVLLACGVVAALLVIQRSGARAMSATGLAALGGWLFMLCYVIGWPRAGANMGGMLTGFVAGGIAWYLAARRSGVRLAWLWPLFTSAALFALVVWTDAHSPQATHVGRFVQTAAQSPATPLALLGNKLEIQWRLLTAPPAFAVYLAAIAFIILVRGPLASIRRKVFRRWSWVGIAIPALFIGGGFGMALNDTGIVMWGLMAGIALAALANLALEPDVMAIINE